MSWTAAAQRRAVAHVFSGSRQFALILRDGTQDGPRIAGELSQPVLQEGAWRVANEGILEFPPFLRSSPENDVVGIAVYDGNERLAVVPTGPVAVAERVQVVLRPRDLWVGVSQ